jgi:hypothetical protein
MESVALFGTTFFFKKTSESGPQEKCFRDAERNGNKFFVHLHRLGVRLFGSYKSIDEFLPIYNALPTSERFGFFEQTRSKAPRRHYFDIEWIEPSYDPRDKEDGLRIVDHIHTRFVDFVVSRQPGSRDLANNVACTDGSRWINGGEAFKHSYHLVYPMLVIPDHPTHKRIMGAFKTAIQDDNRFFVATPTGEIVCRVDFGVYTANRVMRMPLSSKNPGEAPLVLHPPCQLFRNYFITDGTDGDCVVTLVAIEDDLAEVPMRKRRRTGLPIEVAETAASAMLTGEKRDFLRDVLRRAWGLADVEFQDVSYSMAGGTFVIDLAPSTDTCPIHRVVHERERRFLMYVPAKAIVDYYCRASERTAGIDSRVFLRINASVPLFEDTDPVPFAEMYNEPDMRPYRFRLDRGSIMAACVPVEPYSCTTLLIQAHMGVGKTKALYSFLRDLDRTQSVLFVTYRQSLADKYANELKEQAFLHYRRDPFRLRDSSYGPRYVVCFDSIARFDGKYDYIVLDEIDSVLMHCGSPYMRLRDSTLAIFGGMVERAGFVIGLDAHISSLVYSVMERLRVPAGIRAVVNEYRRPCDRVAYVVEEPFSPAILSMLEAGRRIAVCSTTKRFTEDLVGLVRLKLPAKRIIVINSDRGSALLEEDGETQLEVADVDSWTQADLLVYSPSISAGVSFEASHFDTLFVYVHISSYTPLVYDLLQMMARVRILVRGKVYIYFKTRDLSVTKPEALERMPASAAEVVARFNDHDADFVLRLMGRAAPPPCTPTGTYTMDDWRTMLYANIVMRRLRSNAYFETLLYERLNDIGYDIRHAYSATALTDAEAEQQRKEAADAIATLKQMRAEEKAAERTNATEALRALLREHGIGDDIGDDVLTRWIETPQRLRNLPALSELLTTDDVEAWIDDHDAALQARIKSKATVGGKHALMDGGGPRMSWAVRAMAELFGYRDSEGRLRFKPSFLLEPSEHQGRARAEDWRRHVHAYVETHPVPKSGSKRVLETNGDEERSPASSLRLLRELATDIGFDAYTIESSTRSQARTNVVGTSDWQAARKVLADEALYEKLVYQVFKERIDKTAAAKLKPDDLVQMTPQALGRWFVGGCRSDS